MLRIGSGNYNLNNYNIRNNKNMQSQPAFGAKITSDDIINIANASGITGSRVQRLGDMAERIKTGGLTRFLESPMYDGQMQDIKMRPALQKLIEIAESGK